MKTIREENEDMGNNSDGCGSDTGYFNGEEEEEEEFNNRDDSEEEKEY
jgi:hypothetical protein